MVKRRRRGGSSSRRRGVSATGVQDAPSGEQADRMRRKILTTIRENVAFRVLTIDGLHWICPYTGQLVESPFDFEQAALDYLMAEQPWRDNPTLKPLKTLYALRWFNHLRNTIQHEPRLRIFINDGRWLNPYTGQWIKGIHRDQQTITAQTLRDMSSALVITKVDHQRDLLPDETLVEIKNREERSQAAASMDEHQGPQRVLQIADRAPSSTEMDSFDGFSEEIHALFDEESGTHDAAPNMPQHIPLAESHKSNGVPAEVDDALTRHGIELASRFSLGEVRNGHFQYALSTRDRACFLLGRVAGPTDAANQHAATLCEAAHSRLEKGSTLDEVMRYLNGVAHEDLPANAPVALVVALIDPSERSFSCYRAGFPPVVQIVPESSRPIALLGNKLPLLGTDDDAAFEARMEPMLLTLEPGTTLALTDPSLTTTDESFRTNNLLGALLFDAHESPVDMLDAVANAYALQSDGDINEAIPDAGLLVIKVT